MQNKLQIYTKEFTNTVQYKGRLLKIFYQNWLAVKYLRFANCFKFAELIQCEEEKNLFTINMYSARTIKNLLFLVRFSVVKSRDTVLTRMCEVVHLFWSGTLLAWRQLQRFWTRWVSRIINSCGSVQPLMPLIIQLYMVWKVISYIIPESHQGACWY